MKYVLRRLLHAVVLLAAVSLAAFAFSQFAPGDYFSELRNDPRIAPETIEKLREQAGLDRPFLVRYADWIASVARGDFGYSVAYGGPVAPHLGERVRATLLLTVTATLLGWLLAVPLGIGNAMLRNSWLDGAAKAVLAVLLAIPDLLLAICLLALAVETGWFPVGGMPEAGAASAGRTVWHMALPVTVLVLGMLPVLIRHVRAAVLEVIDAPFALSARAQGIPRRRLLIRHLLPAAVNPLVSLFGLSLGTLLSASLLIEVVMGWPGLGPLFLDAIMGRDYAIVLAVILLSTVFLVTGNLLADLLLYRLDPRIRVK
jgi:peptide/nickel transport system permease protein